MTREFVSRWAVADALSEDIERSGYYDNATPHEIATRLVELGWRPGGDE